MRMPDIEGHAAVLLPDLRSAKYPAAVIANSIPMSHRFVECERSPRICS